MALSSDQRAILDLLLRHRLDYEAIAAASRIEVGQARARARAALAELGGADPGAALTDFLLGSTAGERRHRDAIDRLRRDAEANALARRIAAALGAELPGWEAPEIPEHGVTTLWRRSRVIASLGLVAACAVIIGLAIDAVLSDDEGAPAPGREQPAEAGDGEPVRVAMRPVEGGDARGEATIGLTRDAEAYLDLDLNDLAPAPPGEVHLLWIEIRDGKGLPLPVAITVSGQGAYERRLRLSFEIVALLEQGRALEVLLVGRDELRKVSTQVAAAGARAGRGPAQARSLPERPGAVVLRGRIPRL